MLVLPDFEFVRPRTLRDAADALVGAPGEAIVIAGGTDVLPALKRGLGAPTRLVSLRRVEGLRVVRDVPDGGLAIGAGITLAEITEHAVVRARYPALAQAAALVASPPIRAAATLGGNVCLDTRCSFYDQSAFWRGALGHCLKTCGEKCHVVVGGRKCVASMSADTPGPLLVYGAAARLVSAAGDRLVPLARFYAADGAAHTVRGHEEILTEVILPPPREGMRATYVKLRPRRAVDFPLLGVSTTVRAHPDGSARDLSIVVTALGARPRFVGGLDAVVAGGPLDEARIARVAELAHACCHPLPNLGADPAWVRGMVPVLVRRALTDLWR